MAHIQLLAGICGCEAKRLHHTTCQQNLACTCTPHTIKPMQIRTRYHLRTLRCRELQHANETALMTDATGHLCVLAKFSQLPGRSPHAFSSAHEGKLYNVPKNSGDSDVDSSISLFSADVGRNTLYALRKSAISRVVTRQWRPQQRDHITHPLNAAE